MKEKQKILKQNIVQRMHKVNKETKVANYTQLKISFQYDLKTAILLAANRRSDIAGIVHIFDADQSQPTNVKELDLDISKGVIICCMIFKCISG